ncbi:MAG: AMP-binding protein [Burkholderiales bacterium]|nr:AMP-binding protein [Burkholderiales bacterium]
MKPADFFAQLKLHASTARQPALITPECEYSYGSLLSAVQQQAQHLQDEKCALLLPQSDNSAETVITDLAALWAGVVHVPLPTFFSPAQKAFVEHALLGSGTPLSIPANTAKITFTSGTTGTPKGVCLSAEALLSVAQSIASATEGLGIERHLSALPYAVLLENIAGLYAPLWRGVTCVVLPMQSVGLSGSSQFDARILHEQVERYQASSLILLPQMLRAWSMSLAAQQLSAPRCLELVAVGGAAAGVRLLAQARALGIPAYEGYGLSEGASVQTLNLPGADRPGSVGRPLPHTQVRVADDGEIEIRGALFSGYVQDPDRPVPEWWPTGDLGVLDADGYLHIQGRKKNVLITAYGRNVSPEWVETTLKSESAIAQAVVFGNDQPALSAVLWPSRPEVTHALLETAVQAANAYLPDYARIAHWVRADQAFSADTGLATANGRPVRERIEATYLPHLELV